jgi:hypothetical protein
MNRTLRPEVRSRSSLPVKSNDLPRALLDRWIEQWVRRADERWRRTGDLRHYY